MLKKIGIAVLFGLIAGGFSVARADFLGTIVGGHVDIGVGFHAGALEPHIHVETPIQRFNDTDLGIGEYEPDQLWFGVGDGSARLRNLGFAGPEFDFLGVGVNQNFWHLRAGAFAGQPRVGFAAEELDSADGWSDVTFTIEGITSISGSSEFSVWKIDDNNVLQWASTVDGNPSSFVIGVGAHDHWNMAFTGEGVFEVNFLVSATQNGNPFSQASAFTFAVGNANFSAVPEPTSIALLACCGTVLVGVRKWRRKPNVA
ncbi:MAG: choice-of-anchor M domain-containing protein [Pirellula sp.]|jgi:hypothetical protein